MHDHWNDVIVSWRGTRRQTFLRAYSDVVNTALLRRWLPDTIAGRVLKTDLFDEAVGHGIYPFLRSLGASVVGVDISPAVAAAARKRYPELEATTGDVRSLAHADAAFDVVVSNSTLDHFGSVGEIETALLELRRVLKPGGLMVVTLDNPRNPIVALRNALPLPLLRRLRLVPYQVGATCSHKSLARLLQKARFELTDSDAIMHFPRVLAGALAPAAGKLLPESLLAVETLSRLPTRHLTAQFIAARAVSV
jgi:ubiquinone/menaquinone biosynthesis C-methylase UbiE